LPNHTRTQRASQEKSLLRAAANEILRDEMHRRFDASDQKTDAQISLLKSAIRSDAR